MNILNDVEVPESALLQVEQVNRFGSVPGLADEDLLGPDELERQVYRAEFGPILELPFQGSRRWMQPVTDQEGHVDWGAFGTVDFERMQPFDKARYKADKLRERLTSGCLLPRWPASPARRWRPPVFFQLILRRT